MAIKKSFKADINPAMQFISQPEEAKPEETTAAPSSSTGKAPMGYKQNPLYIETKSRRLQLLVQPSLHEKLKKRASKDGKSINEMVHWLLENALSAE